MIVYNRLLKKEDVNSIDNDEELIYYKDNNIAFTINRMPMNNIYVYIIRKKKIFNNQLMEEKTFKTSEQIIKSIA